MTLEEAQTKILEQKTEIENLKLEKTNLSTSLQDIKGDKEKLTNEIKTLREHNMKLFLKLESNETKKSEIEPVEDVESLSIDDILTGF